MDGLNWNYRFLVLNCLHLVAYHQYATEVCGDPSLCVRREPVDASRDAYLSANSSGKSTVLGLSSEELQSSFAGLPLPR